MVVEDSAAGQRVKGQLSRLWKARGDRIRSLRTAKVAGVSKKHNGNQGKLDASPAVLVKLRRGLLPQRSLMPSSGGPAKTGRAVPQGYLSQALTPTRWSSRSLSRPHRTLRRQAHQC